MTDPNHHRTGIVDVDGNLPQFLAHFHKLVAKHQNALHGRWESMWASTQTSAVELVQADDVFAKMVYAFVNPVADHIVEKVHHWPGVSSLGATIADRPLTATRPKTFFRPDGDMPEQISLRLHLPVALTGGPRDRFVARLVDSMTVAERNAVRNRTATGRSIIGRGAVRRQHWNDSPHTGEPRRRLSPRVACRDTWRRIEVLARNKAWLEAYREARALFIAGKKACFPPGTFWLPRAAGASCEPFATS